MDALPIDIELFRKNPEVLYESQRRRHKPVADIDEVIELDKQWREELFKMEQMRKEKNATDKAVGEKMKKKEDATELREKSVSLKNAIVGQQEAVDAKVVAIVKKVNTIGAIVADFVPRFADEKDNAVVRTGGTKREEQGLLSHIDLIRMIDGAEYQQAQVVAGSRAYFLKGDAVLLCMGLQNFALQFLASKSYSPLQTPFFMNQSIMGECAQLEEYDETLYKMTGDGEDKYLIATSEQPISCFHRGEWMNPKELPKRYAGTSTCFRKEAGSHGRDQLGIFRIHQFEKIEQFCVTDPEKSWEMMDEMCKVSEEFYLKLGFHFNVVAIVAGALNNAAAAKYDIEAWFPGSGAFRELVSCSNCVDYQSRRLRVRYGQQAVAANSDETKKYVHMLNATLCAVQRTFCCLLETYQTPDGIRVPECLRCYVGGRDLIPYKFTKAQIDELDAKAAKAQGKKAK
ncbi:putative Serine--tRNA ligase [Blattamonas nauphoetae]|uniref:serine--tRNA ligase n=1 Tax=Blattamonas nauphoetae TaxID=2049346 RepID=A0ABQ9YL22_9EUKA|nr:putative Serine--tRNA ligase [Blattamonas nauphoetae]